MSNTMHELSHGSESSKKRFEPVVIPAIAVIIFLGVKAPQYVLWSLSLLLMLYYGLPKNEPKTENKRKIKQINSNPMPTITPTYNLTREEVIVMLKNSQKEKRGR